MSKKVRLLQAGYEQFTGQLGRNFFVDGLSVEPLLPVHAHFIGSTMAAEYEDGGTINPALNYALSMGDAPDVASEKAGEKVQEMLETDAAAASSVKEVYTREQLEEIADKRGIKGLREIGDVLGVRANSVSALIDDILKAQEA